MNSKARSASRSANPATKPLCRVHLDRYRFVVPASSETKLAKVPSIPGFKIIRDSFVRKQTRIATYRRVRSMENPTTGTKIYVQHRRAHGWLKPFRVTVVGKDSTGIEWCDLKIIGEAFGDLLIRMVEIAFDFDPAAGVDKDFVLRHACFGKSQLVQKATYPNFLRYGARRSPKMVRCYWKKEIQAYRIELEFHSTYLLLPQTECLLHLLNVTEREFQFVRMNWRALQRHLDAKGVRGRRIASSALAHYPPLQRLMRFLRASGVNNPHRFLRPLRINQEIQQAIDSWSDSLRPGVRNQRLSHETENQ